MRPTYATSFYMSKVLEREENARSMHTFCLQSCIPCLDDTFHSPIDKHSIKKDVCKSSKL